MIVLGMVLTSAATSFAAEVSDTAAQSLPHSPYIVLRGQVELPVEGVWHVRSASDETVLQLYVIPPDDLEERSLGRRVGAVVRQRRIDQGQWLFGGWLHDACQDYAKQHDGNGPAAIDDLDTTKGRYAITNFKKSPWPDSNLPSGKLEGPFAFLVPEAEFRFAENERVPQDQREVLAVELRPYVDDGKHWVLYTDGRSSREPVDEEFVKRHKLTIRPVIKESVEQAKRRQSALRYTVVAVRDGKSDDPFDVVVDNPISGQQQTLTWNPSGAKQDESVLKSLRAGREYAWKPYLLTGPAPVLNTWLSPTGPTDAENGERPGDSLTMFSLLGGRAAVEETLQLQGLSISKQDQEATIDVASLRGVEVKAHPYAKMLADEPGGRLALANVVPPDRLFVYVAKPEAIPPFLDKGSDFLAAAGAGLTGNRLDYDLKNRYLQRLGVDQRTLDALLRSGVIRDMAVTVPDLFFIEGTDITVVLRLTQPKLLIRMLSLLSIRGVSDERVLTLKTPDGRPAYWAMRGDILCISSQRDEIDGVLKLIENEGEGSLGRSAEFRYMLTQLPVQKETRMFVYFSDPFVRRLVGPRVKLAQRRRIQASADLETLTARSLLSRLDGVRQINSVAELINMKYLPKGFSTEEYSIDDQDVARSKTYGTLTRLKTLTEVPIERVTPAEAKAYKQYVDNYSRYWRQFFDPIAIRLNDTDDGSLELTTFILPLIDSSIYNRLREALLRHEDEQPLAVPRIEPTPVLQFSMNVSDRTWQQIAGGFGEMFEQYGGASPALLDDLGPGVHLAIFDADPVITLGSGDVMGAFGGNVLRAGGNEMMMIPAALSLLTRRSTILVETRNPQRTARYLRQAATVGAIRDGWFEVSFYQVDDRDSWVWTMSIEGVIKLRFGVEVVDRYLVIRNIPWSTQDRVVEVKDASLNGASLAVWPSACRLQLPGLFASAADQERRATMSGLGRLYPLVVAGSGVDVAAERHAKLFGFRPLHPAGGQWRWENRNLTSSVYGSALRQRQPGYDPSRPFGLMQAIEKMELTMQFEDAGLRSKIRWKLRGE
jgi:hypothetical protein